jgi:hypothetical protein
VPLWTSHVSKKLGYSPLMKEWQDFIIEQEIPEVEVTHFTINKKKQVYIRLGSWNKGLNYSPKTPADIWSAAQANILRVPRVSTTLVSERFAKKIGMLDLQFVMEHGGELKTSNEESVSLDSLDEDVTIESETEVDEEEDINADAGVIIPDRENFPLLHSLFSMNEGFNLFNRLINEILRFNGSKVMTYAKGNNTLGTLLEVPQFQTLKGYE